VKKSDYDALLAEKDSITVCYNETLDAFTAVEAAFQDIRIMENQLAGFVKESEMATKERKAQLLSEIENIKEILKQNREKIANLQARLAASQRENKPLKDAIARLKEELAKKDELIAALEASLAQRDAQIGELNSTIAGLNNDIDQLNQLSAQQQATIKGQENDLYSVWFAIKKPKDLKDEFIIKSGKVALKQGYDMSSFTKADMRDLKSIPLNSKKAIVLSAHPEGSFSLDKGTDKMVTLNISDREKFWSASNYLIIAVK